MRFGILFLLLPILELALFIKVAEETGFFSALLLCIGMAMLGGILVRAQGFSTLISIQDALNRGEMPVERIFDGMCLFIAGAFFILPGFLSDGVGVLLLIPAVRSALRRHLERYLDGGQPPSDGGNDDVIEAEFTRIDDETRLP